MGRKKASTGRHCAHHAPSGPSGARRRPLRPRQQSPGDAQLIVAVSEHVRRHIGPVRNVFHLSSVPAPVHVDVHHVPPRGDRRFHSFITSGMSERPMNVPDGALDDRYGELVMLLPESWLVDERALRKLANRWPIQVMAELASLPHRHDTWIGCGTTIANGEPPEPYADHVGFCCMFVTHTNVFGDSFSNLRVDRERLVQFYLLTPLLEDEMRFTLQYGVPMLRERLDAEGVSPVIDTERLSVCTQRRRL